MKAVIVYESMFGNTHSVAQRVATGLGPEAQVVVLPIVDATPEVLADAHLLIVGGPTHVHGMSSTRTRSSAVAMADKPGHEIDLDPDAEGPGLREWFDNLPQMEGLHGAAFDTRMHGPAVITGQASKGIAKRLRAHGITVLADPESFLVSIGNHLDTEEGAHAEAWGAELAQRCAANDGVA